MKYSIKTTLNPNSEKNWEQSTKGLIYPERKKDWDDMRRGVNANIIYIEHMELAVEIMKKLENNQDFESIKSSLEKLRRVNHIQLEKPLNSVLFFSKQGPAFYKYYYNLKTGENQRVDAIEVENIKFEKKLKSESHLER